MNENLLDIYQQLKLLMKPFENPLIAKFGLDSKYDLWSIKPVEIDGRKKKEVYFGGLIIQSSYVGFYFMPIYSDTDLRTVFGPELLVCLKGKSCFHIKKLDDNLKQQIADALKIGYDLYLNRGWI
jgi:hypothetical protein